MPIDERKANWRFEAQWALPAHIVGFTDFTDKTKLLAELDSLLKRDLVDRSTFPTYISSVELKYKLSDLEVAHTNASTQLPVTGYIQSAPNHKIDNGNLLRWFTAHWSPIDGRLVWNDAYQNWSLQEPTYQHVQVHGLPRLAFAKRGRGKKQVRPNTTSLLYWPSSFASMPPSSIPVLTNLL
jgi:hypothetical protein